MRFNLLCRFFEWESLVDIMRDQFTPGSDEALRGVRIYDSRLSGPQSDFFIPESYLTPAKPALTRR